MNYNEIVGPNALSEFLIEGLSDETLLRIYKEKRAQMDPSDTMSPEPCQLLKEHVSSMFYTAGYNLVSNATSGLVNREQFDELIGR